MTKSVSLRVQAIAALAISLTLNQAAHANLLSNPSFEQGTLVNNGQSTMSLPVGSTAITGWTVVNDAAAWIDAGNPFSVFASDGSRLLDLTDYSRGDPFGGVQQTVATTAGYAYQLSFDLGSNNQYGRPNGIFASAAGTGQTFTGASSGANMEWQRFSMSFVATGPTTTVSLIGQAGQDFIGLDNVDLVLTAVPEPSAAWLLASGLATLMVMRARRRAG
jgi:hypothetical protein